MRREDWPEELARMLREASSRPFAWGEHDCCLFAADVVQAITGEDHAAEFRGRYTTAAGAARALKRYGAGNLVATIDAKLPRIAPALARRGDVVCKEFEDVGPALGICVGIQSAFASHTGIAMHNTLDCDHAWRIE